MENQNTQENSDPKKSFKTQPDGTNTGGDELNSDDHEMSGKVYSNNLMDPAEQEVRENEDASLQDDTYTFDEANTDNEEFHDVGDEGGTFDTNEYY